MIELELEQKQVDILLSALKVAESAFTDGGHFKGAKLVGALHSELWKQIFTYGQMEAE